MIRIKLEGIKEATASFSPGVITGAAKISINEATRAARTAAARKIGEKWNVKAAKLNAELKNVQFAKSGDLVAIIQAKGRPISLTYFGAKEVRPMGRRGVLVQTGRSGRMMKRSKAATGVTVSILKGQQTRLSTAFLATVKSGHIGVFKRLGKSRLPVEDMATITIASMFHQQAVQDATAHAVLSKWNDRFPYHLDRLGK